MLKWSEINQNQNVFFLHGAIHLFFDEMFEVYKVTGKKVLSLIDMINFIVDEITNYSSLIIFEGETKRKKENIFKNHYLKKSFEKLKKTNEDLIIYGCSIINEKDNDCSFNNDCHIWQAIFGIEKKEGRKIYIGIHETDLSKFEKKYNSITEVINKNSHHRWIKDKSLICFSTAIPGNIWGTEK